MTTFTGLQYLYISLANCFGLDKVSWQERLDWATNIYSNKTCEEMTQHADEPMMFRKTWNAIADVYRHGCTDALVPLDATASGLQILAVLIGCKDTASNVNLINTGMREDVYGKVATTMVQEGAPVTRSDIKKPLMTTFYGSKKQPELLFGEGSVELQAFYKALERELGGALEAMDDIQACWQPDALAHTWTLPDGHTAYVPVMVEKISKVEVDELNHTTFTHHHYVNHAAEDGISLAANVVHSIDGYIVREMHRRAYEQGFQMLSIHDSFWAHPNYMNNVRQNYLDILIEIADSNLLQSILREITGDDSLEVIKRSNDLSKYMVDAEYALS